MGVAGIHSRQAGGGGMKASADFMTGYRAAQRDGLDLLQAYREEVSMMIGEIIATPNGHAANTYAFSAPPLPPMPAEALEEYTRTCAIMQMASGVWFLGIVGQHLERAQPAADTLADVLHALPPLEWAEDEG